MAWIWLWSRPEAPKLVYDPWNGPKMFPPTARDWFKSISWPFKALQHSYIKKTLIILYGQECCFLIFQLCALGHGKCTKLPVFFSEFWVQNFESFWNFQKSLWWPKKPWNCHKTIHIWFPQLTRPPKNMFFLPQKGPYLPNRPNRKRAWDSVTRRVRVYREKFNIDFLFQKFFLTSQHILGLPKKIWAKNPMLNFQGGLVNWGHASIETLRNGPKWDISLNFIPGGTPTQSHKKRKLYG